MLAADDDKRSSPLFFTCLRVAELPQQRRHPLCRGAWCVHLSLPLSGLLDDEKSRRRARMREREREKGKKKKKKKRGSFLSKWESENFSPHASGRFLSFSQRGLSSCKKKTRKKKLNLENKNSQVKSVFSGLSLLALADDKDILDPTPRENSTPGSRCKISLKEEATEEEEEFIHGFFFFTPR